MRSIYIIGWLILLSTSNTLLSDCGPCKEDCGVSSDHCQTPAIGIPCAAPQTFVNNPGCPLRCSTGGYSCGTSQFLPRSQGDNTAREMVEFNTFIYKYNVDQNYTWLAIAIEYTKTFRSCPIAQSLFCTNCLTFTGSQVPSRRNGSDVIADNFGLAPDFKGTLKIKPRIENYIIDVSFFLGLDEWLPGLFFKGNMPIVHSRWNLGLDECFPCDNLVTVTAQSVGSGQFPVCYMTQGTPLKTGITVPGFLFPDFTGAQGIPCVSTPPELLCTGTPAPNLRQALSGDFLFGDMQTFWNFGKFDFCARNRTRVADVDLMLGYNFLSTPWSNIAVYAKMVAPTGNRPKAKFVFEPIVGNGKFWEFGLGTAGHITLLGDPCYTYHTLNFYWEGNFVHFFTTHQRRSFDFIENGLLSRYLLLKEFEKDGITYKNNLINAINFATRNAKVSIDFQGDLSFMLEYRNDSWLADIGYNIWGRTAEKVCIATDCPCDIDRRKFGIKGTEGVCAREYTVLDDTFDMFVDATSLNSTQSNATMFQAGTVDNSLLVPPSMPGDIVVTALSRQVEGSPIVGPDVVLAANSNPPVLITCANLDPNSAALSSALTHKFFANLGYCWFDTCWEPHIGIGAEVEFDGKRPHKQSLNQWGVWIKTGLTF